MGTLRGASEDPKGAVVNGVILGDPALDVDGKPVWDDNRIPDGDVEPAPTKKDKGNKTVVDRSKVPVDVDVFEEKPDKPVMVRKPKDDKDVKVKDARGDAPAVR
jgi:hypothetical protein